MNDRTGRHGYQNQMVNNQRRTREQQLTFAEIEFEQPERKGAEPFVVIPERGEREVDWQQSFRYVSRERQFVEQARELEWKGGAVGEFVPFHAYWPTYEQMQPGQLRWYLYWRGEVRSGRYPDTDLSYLFVYLYELIHGIGTNEPAEGYKQMQQVWLAYRERYPKLEAYVREWLYDYGLVFGLDVPPSEPLQKLPRNLSLELKELEWKRRFTAEPLALTWDMLRTLVDYDVEKSRFYTGQGRKDLQLYASKAVALVDGYLSKIEGARLLKRFMPREKIVSRPLFRTAVYNHELYGRSVTVSVLPISTHLPLRSYLTQLVRFTENKLRELLGFRGKLRGIQLEPEVEQLVERFLHKEFEQRKAEEAKASLPRVKINVSKLQRTQWESDEVRDMLTVEEQAPVTGERREGAVPPLQLVKGSKVLDPEKAAKLQQAELDFERGWMEPEEIEHTQVRLVSTRHDFKEDSIATRHQAQPPSETNMRDDSESLDTEISAVTGRCKKIGAEEIGMELPGEWREVFARLSTAHLKMLSALLDGADAAVRFSIAERAGSMPELLLDEINEIAMECIGDLLVDGDEIAREYKEELRSLLS
ncbi:TerB N-terminal domain-containing protein [Paenibacillus fonticola]|uniref:TerB N-terminal domain-containing protein n=1 Tax=Paenibacillus fonticola TaxID=379896 RepID=UPI000363D5D1|nr:TerB N-terminal domain-containing protein [Paenibacillus fonticola]